jgi:small subunit ribosomal protein S3
VFITLFRYPADIEKRIAFRRVMKQTIEKVMKAGAEGVKIVISGRLNGAEIARRETLTQGKIPLHTLRANIAYSRGIAQTTYGTIGLKIWIYKGLQFEAKEANKVKREEIKQK